MKWARGGILFFAVALIGHSVWAGACLTQRNWGGKCRSFKDKIDNEHVYFCSSIEVMNVSCRDVEDPGACPAGPLPGDTPCEDSTAGKPCTFERNIYSYNATCITTPDGQLGFSSLAAPSSASAKTSAGESRPKTLPQNP